MTLWPGFLNKLSEGQRQTALTKRGMTFIFRFLFKKGHHLFIIGVSGMGKTLKAVWCANWIRHTKETVIWIDSAKNGEMLYLIGLDKENNPDHVSPVRIICPKDCDVEITEWSTEEHKYVKMKDHPEVVQVPDAGSAWWAVKKGMINIFCFRVAFANDDGARAWMGELFNTLSIWIRRHQMPHILPFALFGDESHWFIAGEKITSDTQRNRLSELITELSLEDRAHGVRLVLMAQSHKSLPPASRENMIHNLLCGGSKVSPDENPALSKWNNDTAFYQPNQGLFVYQGGYTYPEGWPWPFPLIKKQKLRVNYIGEFAPNTEKAIEEREIETELTPTIDKYQSIVADLQGYEAPHNANRYEVIPSE